MDSPMKQALLASCPPPEGTPRPRGLDDVPRGIGNVRWRRTTTGATTRIWRCTLNSREAALFFHEDSGLRRSFRTQLTRFLANEMLASRCHRCELYDTHGNPLAEFSLPR